jgi:hypothetical protein
MKALPMLFLMLVLGGLLFWAFLGWAQMPMVYQSTSKDKPVACVAKESNWQELAINDPLCRSVLKGKYEVVWVK